MLRIASAGSGEPPTRQCSSIRSVTSRPAFLRASWTSRTMSRSRPSQAQLVRQFEVQGDGVRAARWPPPSPSAASRTTDQHRRRPIGSARRPPRRSSCPPGSARRTRRRRRGRGGDRGRDLLGALAEDAGRARGSSALTDSSTSSPASARPASSTTLSSSRTCVRRSSGSASQPGAETSACASGWRVFTFDVGPGRAAQLDQPAHQRDLLVERRRRRALASVGRPLRQVHRVDVARRSRRTAPTTPSR